MSVKRITVKHFSKLKNGKTNWARLRRMKDDEVNFSDIPELTDGELARMVWSAPRSDTKVMISIRVDPDVLEWYKHLGRDYRSRMHMVLRAFMQARQAHGKPKKPTRRAA